jgi:hypothetical protein
MMMASGPASIAHARLVAVSTPIKIPVAGRVVKIHRMSGHYVGNGDPIVDVQVNEMFRVTVCAPFAGKIMRCRDVGTSVNAGDKITELTGVGKPTWELFIAYRRADAPGHAGRIGERLINYFGPGQVFKDIEALPLGVDFIDFIREKLQRAFVTIVVIGRDWVEDRLHDPHDLHREEIRTALERGLHIVPAEEAGASGGYSATRAPQRRRNHRHALGLRCGPTRGERGTGFGTVAAQDEVSGAGSALGPRRFSVDPGRPALRRIASALSTTNLDRAAAKTRARHGLSF